MHNKSFVFLGLVLLIVMTAFITLTFSDNLYNLLGFATGGYTKEEVKFFNKFIATKDLIKSKYYQEIDDDDFYEGALHGMAEAVGDPYTSYFEKEDSDTLLINLNGVYNGIGIYVTANLNDNKIIIVSVIDNTPASKAGVLAGDQILSVNGQEYSAEDMNTAINEIKVSKEVALVLLRDGKKIEKNIVIEEIELNHLEYKVIEDIGYIFISSFDEKVYDHFMVAYNELISKNVKGLIIDLRNNHGGSYDQTLMIAKEIIPKGLIVYTEDKDKNQEKVFADGEGIKIPLVVLTNGASASASEVLAGAVKDRGTGILIGTKTYGKGLVQGLYQMKDGTSIKITIAKYFTPNGICIDGEGIEPDIVIENTRTTDRQLAKAIEVIKEKQE